MNEDRLGGTAKNIAGKAQESFGRVAGDARTQVEGIANQVKGTAQDLYGQAREGASQVACETAAAARQTASSFESSVREVIETRPYTAVLIALGIGWLLGGRTVLFKSAGDFTRARPTYFDIAIIRRRE